MIDDVLLGVVDAVVLVDYVINILMDTVGNVDIVDNTDVVDIVDIVEVAEIVGIVDVC